MEYVVGSVLVREMDWAANPETTVDGHKHNFGHARLILRGAANVEELDDQYNVTRRSTISAREGGARYLVNIKAGVRHRITPVETKEVDPRALRAVLRARGMATDDIDAVIAEASFAVPTLAACVYSHRVPQALVERMGSHPEFDALMERVIALGNEVHGDIVQVYDGWTPAYV